MLGLNSRLRARAKEALNPSVAETFNHALTAEW
jgi:hypothetical protein